MGSNRYNDNTPTRTELKAHLDDGDIHSRNAFVTSGFRNMLNGSYITFGVTNGASGYGLRDNGGVMEWKNSGGAWAGFSGGGDIRFIALNSFSIDTDAGKNWVVSNIEDSIAIGVESQYTNNDGYGVISIGSRSLHSIIANWGPTDVIAIGSDCGYGLQKPSNSILIGNEILYQIDTLANGSNIMIGHRILGHAPNFEATYNVIIGYEACHTATMISGADNNVIIGSVLGDNLTTAYSNVIIGMGTGNPLTSGNYNVMIGNYCANQVGSGITTGSLNTLLGNNAGLKLRGDSSYMVCIGTNSGPKTAGTYNNKLYIDDHNDDTPLIYADFVTHAVTINGTLTVTDGIVLSHASLSDLSYAAAGHTGFEPTITNLTVVKGGTALATVASGSVLVANALDTISALTSTSGTKMLVNTAGVLSFETVTGTGAPVLAGSPTFTTQISTPKVTASDANGLSLFEDGGFGIVIQDGGNPLVSRANDHTQVSIENSESSTAKYPGLIVDNYIGASAGHGVSAFRSAAGTKAIPTAMPVSITVGAFIWYAHDGTDFREIGRFQMVTGHNFAAGDREGDFLLKTVDGTTSTTRMIAYHDGIIYFNGLVGIGTATPSAKLAINGGLAVGEDADPGDNNLKVVGNVEIDGALNHDGTTVGLYGTIPVVQGAALTVQLTTITYTAPGTPDYALQDLVQNTGFGFVTKDEGNTVLSVIKNLQDRVAQLEARLGSSTGVGLFT